ncbi:hypothetical protein L207DRAFT_575881 [Hyaloscypha variabilis F]|uniref:Uncharacterized protein n=1 Tax=Hyaloscypha variabilis (strain UAMH 11265 / GT02V1 / F) TaxID=1149755 RepID=A0A2J6S8J7_HYAVF|nr:hypothetical protein L207DRAFT_575881 [Hyaloscypha variabilis F]
MTTNQHAVRKPPAVIPKMSTYIMPQPLSKQESFALISKCLDLLPSAASETSPKQRTIFLSIDIESTPRAQPRVNEVGVSILDTADLSSPTKPCSQTIKSHNFRTRPKYWYSKPTKSFLFGTRGRHPNPLYESEGVQVVLVGHEVRVDMKIMEDCFPGIWENTVISALDIGKEEYRGLHCGGNDANHTLKALLLTAFQHVDANVERQPVNEQRIELIERVVRSCVPIMLKDAPQFERKRKQWDNVKDVGESLDDLGVGWSELIFNPSL